jgi:Holliday junction resolvase-like predicted endonuclease
MTHPEWATRPIRFDVVALTHYDDDIRIDWIRDAFST